MDKNAKRLYFSLKNNPLGTPIRTIFNPCSKNMEGDPWEIQKGVLDGEEVRSRMPPEDAPQPFSFLVW